jgi:colanic acid/amylovoran biosynthesis glycosyltransferase
MREAGISRIGARVRLAYLCNLYPAVSHSFVRREIEGVEAEGHEVHRFSIRPAKKDLCDPADLQEAERTQTILNQGWAPLIGAAIALLISHPRQTLRAMGAAWQLAGPGLRSKARQTAYWLEAAWLVRKLEELGIEHLHAHFGTNPAAVGAIARAWGGPTFSFTVHGPDEFDEPSALALSRKIAAASFVVAISSFGRSQLMRWSSPWQWEKLFVVRCGVDASFLETVPASVPADSTQFLCVARLSAQKGLPLLIAACDRLRSSGRMFGLTIIGDGEMRRELEHQIRRRGLEGYVTLAGVRSAAEIREQLRTARAFVLPSFAEGLPVVLMEALALERPVIATAIAGIPELVDAECGWLIPAGFEDGLLNAMSEALVLPADVLRQKGNIGRDRVRRLHDARQNARELAALFTLTTTSVAAARADVSRPAAATDVA